MDDYDFGDNSLDELHPSACDQLGEVNPAASKAAPKVEPTEVYLKKPLPAPPSSKRIKLGISAGCPTMTPKDESLGSGPSASSPMT